MADGEKDAKALIERARGPGFNEKREIEQDLWYCRKLDPPGRKSSRLGSLLPMLE